MKSKKKGKRSNKKIKHNIVFNTNDREKWEKILFYIEKTANREIQNQLPALRAVSRDPDLMFYIDKMNDETNKLYDSKLIK